MPSLSDMISSASRTASKLYSGSPMPIITTLVTRRLPFRRFAIDPVIETITRDHDLPDDLARGQVAHQALRAGVAE